jgi:site-specific DNA-methyltransferase (adenine-specific)
MKFEIEPLVAEMLNQLPSSVWSSKTSTFFDPAIGGGQFVRAIEQRLRSCGHSDANIRSRVFGFEESDLHIRFAVNKYKLVGQYVRKPYEKFLEMDNTMKFDVVVGNPPFSGSKNDIEGSRAKQLYKEFVSKSLELSNNVYMVMPSLWTHKTGSLKTELYNFGLKKCASCTDKFTVDIGICYIIAEKGYVGSLTVKPENATEYSIDWNDKTPIHLNSSEAKNNILNKIKSSDNLGNIWARSSMNRNDSTIGKGCTNVIDITGPEGTTPDVIKTTISASEFPGFNSWKVITNNVLGAPKIGVTKVIGPGFGTSYSVVSLIAQSEKEANNLKAYIDSKFVSFIVKCIKNNGANSKVLFSSIPSIDFTKSWTDKAIYKHFGLTQEEIDYVEANVK